MNAKAHQPLARAAAHWPARLFLLVLAVLGMGSVLMGLLWGSQGWEPWWQGEAAQSLLALRWPRALGAWLAGAALALAGLQAQTLFRNPLADPYLLGSATGAGLGVAVVLWLSQSAWVVAGAWSPVMGGFMGAWLALGLVLILVRGQVQGGALIMAGMVVSVLLGATLALLLRNHPQLMPAMQGFMLGQTLFLDPAAVHQLAWVLLLCGLLSWWWGPALDAMSLGDDVALSLGVQVGRMRALHLALLSALTATAVAHLGLVAFVGWVAPHLVARWLPRAMRWRMLGAVLAGGLVLSAADGLARTVVAPQEWPVGLITAWLGGAWMLWQMRSQGRGDLGERS